MPHLRVKRKNGELEAAGPPDARPGARTTPFGLSLGLSLSPHGGPSLCSSAPHHSHPPTPNHHSGLGAARNRPIRARIAANNARGTTTSASWNVTARVWCTTLAPILI